MAKYKIIDAINIETGIATLGAAGKHVGEVVTVEKCEVDQQAILRFDDGNALITSRVEVYWYHPNGDMTINTRNTQYQLEAQ